MVKRALKVLVPVAVLGAIVVWALSIPSVASYQSQPAESKDLVTPDEVAHIDTPGYVRAIYMTSCVAGAKDETGKHAWRTRMMDMISTTELNALVLDIKDYTGKISFKIEGIPEGSPLLGYEKSDCFVSDMKEFIEELHARDIYVIGRVSVFQDPSLVRRRPDLAVRRKDNQEIWKDRKGLSWIDAGATYAWDYIVEIAKAAYDIGVDEINFDYIRFPSDGDMDNVMYKHYDGKISKASQIEEFFSYLHSHMKRSGDGGGSIPTSADLFGEVSTSYFDLNIGQVLERALPYFDYIAPMTYPSHYRDNWGGLGDPNKNVYKIIKINMDNAVARAVAASSSPTKIRTWLQDFDYGGDYGEQEVRDQKQAVYDAGLLSWMLWDPAVRYTKEALD